MDTQPAASTTCSPAIVQFSTTVKAKPHWLERMQVYADQGQTSAAVKELEQAAHSGDRLALVLLGDMLERGACVPANSARAGELYAEAVRKGDGMAMLFLGYLLETSKAPQDIERAKDLYRRSLLDLWLPEDDLWAAVYGAAMGWRGITPLLLEQRQWLKGVFSNWGKTPDGQPGERTATMSARLGIASVTAAQGGRPNSPRTRCRVFGMSSPGRGRHRGNRGRGRCGWCR